MKRIGEFKLPFSDLFGVLKNRYRLLKYVPLYELRIEEFPKGLEEGDGSLGIGPFRHAARQTICPRFVARSSHVYSTCIPLRFHVDPTIVCYSHTYPTPPITDAQSLRI